MYIVFTHGIQLGRWDTGTILSGLHLRKCVVKGSYFVGIVMEVESVQGHWCNLGSTFGLALVTPAFKILSGLYLGNCKV